MEPSRETISLLLASIVGGLALTYSITEIQTAFVTKGLSVPLYSIVFFIVFVSVWLRFIPGNLSHIRRLERWPNISVRTWLLDLSVITVEGMILVFMAMPSVESPDIFFYALLVLLFIDIGWLAATVRGVKKRTRPEPLWIWMWLNIPSAAIVVFLCLLNVLKNQDYPLTSEFSMGLALVVFVACAIIDIVKSASTWFGRPEQVCPSRREKQEYDKYMKEALDEAKTSLSENGIPIGAVLVEDGNVIGKGHNRRVQGNDPMAHAEVECLKNAKRRQSYEETTLYTTLMPCCLCAGAIVHCGIKKVVVGEAENFEGARTFLEDCGIKLIILDIDECKEILREYIQSHESVWNEDIGRQ